MKYIIFSDIHGNIDAFKQFLIDIHNYESIDGLIFCGDIMGYYYHANDILSSIQSLKNLVIVKGNHDVNYLNSTHNNILLDEFITKYGNSYNLSISNENLIYLSHLPNEITININDKRVGIFHGAPFNNLNGRIYPDTPISKEEINIINKYDIIFLGHTHYKMIRKVGDTIIINPGSLGQPRDGLGFSYCIFDFDLMTPEFKNVDIDISSLLNEIESHETSLKNIDYLKSVLKRKRE